MTITQDDELSRHRSSMWETELQNQLSYLQNKLRDLLVPSTLFQSRLARDVSFIQRLAREEEGTLDCVVLASKLTNVGYKVSLRSALGGGQGIKMFQSLRNQFLVVACDDVDFIVEPNFFEHWQISHPTPRYSGLLDMVPTVLVASSYQLCEIVQLLCSEMSIAFAECGLSLPPWRQAASLLSKWLPRNSRDVDMSPGGSPRLPSPETFFQSDKSSRSGTTSPHGGYGEHNESPRAVLCQASALLSSKQTPPKSLLSANLAAVTKGEPKPLKPFVGSIPIAGQVDRPIRKVRMQGASKSTRN